MLAMPYVTSTSFLRAFCYPFILQNELDYKSIRMQLKKYLLVLVDIVENDTL